MAAGHGDRVPQRAELGDDLGARALGEPAFARCRALGLRVTELPPVFDVDEPDDLRTLEEAARLAPGRAPRVAAFFRGET